MGYHVSNEIASRVTVMGEGDAAGEGRVVGVPKSHSWQVHHAINEYQLRLNLQRLVWPLY